MLPFQDALSYVLQNCRQLKPALTPVAKARGLVLAQDVVALEAIPPFANTAMDGFALRSSDVGEPPATLRIIETIAAGHSPKMLVKEGEASRIMTGAPIPDGANAIVMVEQTEVDGDEVTVNISVPVGNHIRPIGDDVPKGELVFEEGTILTPGHLGVLSSLGFVEVIVFPRPRVGVISTGDELVADGSALKAGQIRDSNRRTLLALLEENDMSPVDLGLLPDNEDAIEKGLVEGAAACDALITSGGVSMGDFDYVKSVLQRIGDMRWMQVDIKPAKPLAFGLIGDTPIFGLPGNPVSSMVSFELFARPGLRVMMGRADPLRKRVMATAAESLGRRPDGKTHFVRAIVDYADGKVFVRSGGGQGSHMLAAMARSNSLAILPDGSGYSKGDSLEVLILD